MLALPAGLCLVLATNPYLDEGRRLLKALDYEKAEGQLVLALQVPTSSADERREAYHLIARALAARGKLDEVEQRYATMLAADPHAPAPEDAPPKIRDAFRRAKEGLYPKGYVQLLQLPVGSGVIDVQVIDPWDQVASLAVREADAKGFASRDVALAARRARVELKALAPGESLRFFVEARSADGHPLASLGSADKPLELSAPALSPAALAAMAQAPAVEAAPRSKAYWVPVLITALALGAAFAGAGFGVASRGDSSSAGMTPWADDRAAFDRRAAQRATVANGCFIAAGVLGVGAALAWVW